jgi:NAD(P) transhydrogenase subunit alpha
MKVAVPREVVPNERRVALTPDATAALVKAGLDVLVETAAGMGAFFSDAVFRAAGATIVPSATELYGQADIVLKVQKPVQNESLGRHEVDLMREGVVLIALLQALTSPELVQRLVGAPHHELGNGSHSAHQPRPADGCPFLVGQHRGV